MHKSDKRDKAGIENRNHKPDNRNKVNRHIVTIASIPKHPEDKADKANNKHNPDMGDKDNKFWNQNIID